MTTVKTKRITINNRIDELPKAVSFLEEALDEWSMPQKYVFPLILVAEELLVNIISYGYDDDLIHEIDIELSISSLWLELRVKDDANYFDPTKAEKKSGDDFDGKTIGGWGIHLIRNNVDFFEYKKIEEKNITIMKKSIEL